MDRTILPEESDRLGRTHMLLFDPSIELEPGDH
jgi:hypothetical protein